MGPPACHIQGQKTWKLEDNREDLKIWVNRGSLRSLRDSWSLRILRSLRRRV